MKGFDSLGFGGGSVSRRSDPSDRVEHVLTQRPLSRILAFTRRTIDDVVNDRLAKNEVLGYFRLSKQIERAGEVRELEQQWNAVARIR